MYFLGGGHVQIGISYFEEEDILISLSLMQFVTHVAAAVVLLLAFQVLQCTSLQAAKIQIRTLNQMTKASLATTNYQSPEYYPLRFQCTIFSFRLILSNRS